jgi:hypothetical protein
MQQDLDQDRERRIGIGLLIGLAAFALVALASYYFGTPAQLAQTVRDNVAYSTR